MKVRLALMSLAFLVSAVAFGQHTYEGDGFYVSVEGRSTIAIGVTDGSLVLFTDDDDREMDVEVYHGTDLREGYVVTADEISDPDFVVNIKGSEMCTVKSKDAARFARAMRRARGGAVLRVDVVDVNQREGKRRVYWRVPADGTKAIAESYSKFGLW